MKLTVIIICIIILNLCSPRGILGKRLITSQQRIKSLAALLVFIILLSNGVNRCFSQNLFYNKTIITVKSSASVYIKGGLKADGSGSVNNGGTVYISNHSIAGNENWTNNASDAMLSGTGTVIFNSSEPQNIQGTFPTTFYDLKINNSSSGVTLSKNVVVTNQLTLTDGVVVTGANFLILKSVTATDLLPATPTSASFINGNLRRIISGSQTYVFPLGDGTATTNYKRIDFITAALDLAGDPDYITAKVFTVSEGTCPVCTTSINTSEDGTSIINVHGESAIWDITTSGVYSSGSYGVNLYVKNITGLSGSDNNQFTVVKSDDGTVASTDYTNWKTFDAATTIPGSGAAGRIYDSGNGYAKKEGFTSFSEFVIGKGGAILPVELLYFTAEWNNKIQTSVLLKWTTASEINNDHFELEHSSDAISWQKIATIQGAGNSNEMLLYSYYDENPYDDRTYYRLKQIDFDGSNKYSNIEVVSKTHFIEFISIYPNPSEDFIIVIVFSSIETDVNLFIVDASGKRVFEYKTKIKKCQNTLYLNTNNLASGEYIVNVVSESGQEESSKIFVCN